MIGFRSRDQYAKLLCVHTALPWRRQDVVRRGYWTPINMLSY